MTCEIHGTSKDEIRLPTLIVLDETSCFPTSNSRLGLNLKKVCSSETKNLNKASNRKNIQTGGPTINFPPPHLLVNQLSVRAPLPALGGRLQPVLLAPRARMHFQLRLQMRKS